MAKRVIALDPGGRSGWAEAHMSRDRLEYREGGVLPQGEVGVWLASQQGVQQGVPVAVVRPRWDVFVCESWRPRRRAGSMDWIEGSPLIYAQQIGEARLAAKLSGATFKMQEPRDKYDFATGTVPPPSYPTAFKEIDALSSEQHDQDARYHLWVYFFRNWFTGKVNPDVTVILP